MDDKKTLEDLSLISDSEKIVSFNVALGIARELQINFFDAYKNVLNKIIERKNNKADDKENKIIDELKKLQEIPDEVKRPTNDDLVKNEQRSNEEIITMLNEEKEQIMKKVFEKTKKNGNTFSTGRFINDARNGVINNSNFFKEFDYNLTNDEEKQSFTNDLIELNEKSREITYFNYMTSDDEKIAHERNKEITNYSNLIDYFQKNKENWQIVPNTSSWTVENIIKVTKHNGTGRILGINTNNYDDLYENAIRYKNNTHKGSNFPENLYNGFLELMNKNKEKIAAMSLQEFREYKIELMELSKEELEKYKKDIDSKKIIENNNKTL